MPIYYIINNYITFFLLMIRPQRRRLLAYNYNNK